LFNREEKWVYSVNRFFKWIGKPKFHLPIPHVMRANKQILSCEERDRFLETASKDPLHNIVALAEYDELLRPSEIANLKISDIDFDNHMLYVQDSKVGNTSVPMSPRFEETVLEYLKVRPKPKSEYNEYLIINKNSRGHLQKYKYSTA
jgi:integrase